MFVVPGPTARRDEREEQWHAHTPGHVGPQTATAPESGNSRTPNASTALTAPARAEIATITTLIPSTGRLSVATPKEILACAPPCAKGPMV